MPPLAAASSDVSTMADLRSLEAQLEALMASGASMAPEEVEERVAAAEAAGATLGVNTVRRAAGSGPVLSSTPRWLARPAAGQLEHSAPTADPPTAHQLSHLCSTMQVAPAHNDGSFAAAALAGRLKKVTGAGAALTMGGLTFGSVHPVALEVRGA